MYQKKLSQINLQAEGIDKASNSIRTDEEHKIRESEPAIEDANEAQLMDILQQDVIEEPRRTLGPFDHNDVQNLSGNPNILINDGDDE